MRAGKQDKGVENLTELLKTTDNPELINNAAYELADADKELALDEQKQRLAVDILTKATRDWTLDGQADVMSRSLAGSRSPCPPVLPCVRDRG